MLFGLFRKETPKEDLKHKNQATLENILEKKIPSMALKYAMDLWIDQPFSFKVTRTRNTCLGNYSFRNGQHQITVNHDLNPYSFLITYIHEVAHQRTLVQYMGKRKRPLPHGQEWKNNFKQLMAPVLNNYVFPPDVLKVLSAHMQNPAASSSKDPLLVKTLARYSENQNPDKLSLGELKNGSLFHFHNKVYKKLEDRRTRTLVEAAVGKRKYTISSHAEVEQVN